MATGFNAVAKDSMLEGLKVWAPVADTTAFTFGAFTTDADAALVVSTNGTYSIPASGAMNITANVVINIPADNSIAHMRIYKVVTGTGAIHPIYGKAVTTMTFTYAGTITITSAQISLVDPV